MFSSRCGRWAAPWLLVALAVGCNKLVEQAKEAADKAVGEVAKVKESMSDAATTAQEQLSLAGNMELTVGEPLKTDACYVHLVHPGTGRTAVLQLQSYRAADQETFPSVFLQAQTDAATPADLIGKVMSGRMFVQRAADGPVLFSEVNKPVEVLVESIADKTIIVKLVTGALHDSATGTSTPVTNCTFTGILE